VIAITNDDGVAAPGLQALKQVLRCSSIAYQCFTSEHAYSGAGTSLATGTGRSPRLVAARGDEWLFDAAPPAFLAAVACSRTAGSFPHAFLSGVNFGPNVGRLALHSGTVGAALTAGAFGISSLAISCDDVYATAGDEDGPPMMDLPAALAVTTIPFLTRQRTPVVLSINVPNVDPWLVRGVEWASFSCVHPKVEMHTDGTVRLSPHVRSADAGSDAALLREGVVTISRLSGRLTRPAAAQLLGALRKQLLTSARP
jgi:5'-nucleotidase